MPNSSGSAYWRLIDPLNTLKKVYPNEYDVKIIDRPITVEDCEWADLFITQSIIDIDSLSLIYYYKKDKGKKFILEVDDYIKLNDDNPYAIDHKKTNAKEIISACMGLADGITVTTNYLAKKVKKFNKNVAVLPNYMLMDRWDLPTLPNDSEEVRIGYTGSITHKKDVEYIVKPLIGLLINRPNVKLILVGDPRLKNLFKNFEHRVEMYLGVPFEDYPTRLHGLRFDIGLAPLRPTEFNKCKSGIKALEYGICKVPVIASSIHPYIETVKNDKTGFLAIKESAWITYLEILIDNKERRRKMGKASYELVKRKYNLETNIHMWHTYYQSLFK